MNDEVVSLACYMAKRDQVDEAYGERLRQIAVCQRVLCSSVEAMRIEGCSSEIIAETLKFIADLVEEGVDVRNFD